MILNVKVKFAIGTLISTALIGSTQAATSTLFLDPITGYDTSIAYPDQNTDVHFTENNGGNLKPGEAFGPSEYHTALSGQYINIRSGNSNYTTFATDHSTTGPYGQVLARVAYDGPGGWFRIGLFNDTNAVYGSTNESGIANEGIGVSWHPSNLLKYWDGSNSNRKQVAWDESTWHDVTINYDLNAGTYDLWVDNTLIEGDLGIKTAFSFESLAVGGKYWSSSGWGGFLDYWHWIESSDTAFSGPGSTIPEPASLGLVVGGIVLLLTRKMKIS